jgi:hypothetical protein
MLLLVHDIRKLLQCAKLLRHRGPDWSGIHIQEFASTSTRSALAHERLAIVDMTAGEQPLLSSDGKLALCVNGEIYNHQALRSELTTRYSFATNSDCEVSSTITIRTLVTNIITPNRILDLAIDPIGTESMHFTDVTMLLLLLWWWWWSRSFCHCSVSMVRSLSTSCVACMRLYCPMPRVVTSLLLAIRSVCAKTSWQESRLLGWIGSPTDLRRYCAIVLRP